MGGVAGGAAGGAAGAARSDRWLPFEDLGSGGMHVKGHREQETAHCILQLNKCCFT